MTTAALVSGHFCATLRGCLHSLCAIHSYLWWLLINYAQELATVTGRLSLTLALARDPWSLP